MPVTTRPLILDARLLDEAEALDIDASKAAEAAIATAIHNARAEEWKRENQAAIEAWNEWTDKNGLPLAKYRQF